MAISIAPASITVVLLLHTATAFICPTLFDFYPDPEDCTKFYRCFWGAAYPFHCPTGTKWNHKLLTCDFSFNVDCDGSNHVLGDSVEIKEEEPVTTKEVEYDYNGDHEYGKETHPWDVESYETPDDTDDLPDYMPSYDTDSEEKHDHNIPIHIKNPGEAESGEEAVTPQSTLPSSLSASSTTEKSLIDYLYPDYVPGKEKQYPDQNNDNERSDVTHDYAWYEGRDYNPDYMYGNNRQVDHGYDDYLYDYNRGSQGVDYGNNPRASGGMSRGFTTDSGYRDYSFEVSYFQNGYPGYRHHYEPDDFLSPAYARHNGPIGRRK